MFDKKLEGIINRLLDEYKVPSLQIAITQKNNITYCNAFGYRDMENNICSDTNTLYAIGSVTKSFAATALAILVDEGKIKWDDPIIKYIPEFKMYDDYVTQNITIRDITSHKSGLPRHDFMWFLNDKTMDEIVSILKYLKPNQQIRYNMQYQNHMYILIGYIIEKVTSKKWNEFIKEKILDPLGMINTNFSIKDTYKEDNIALPYAGLKNIEKIKFKDIDNISSAAAMNSNVKDMIRWVQLNLNKGYWNGKQIISKENLKECHSPQMIIREAHPWNFDEIDFEMYGFGWYTEVYRGHKVVYHNGNVDGFSAVAAFIPDKNIGFVLLANRSYAKIPVILQYILFDMLLGYEIIDWNKRFSQYIDLSINKYEENIKKLKKDAILDTKSTLSLENYTGEYVNSAYGKIIIKEEKEKLIFDYGDLVKELEHLCLDTFLITIPVELFTSPIKFRLNELGRVEKLEINIEPVLGEYITFVKKEN